MLLMASYVCSAKYPKKFELISTYWRILAPRVHVEPLKITDLTVAALVLIGINSATSWSSRVRDKELPTFSPVDINALICRAGEAVAKLLSGLVVITVFVREDVHVEALLSERRHGRGDHDCDGGKLRV